MSDKPPRIAVEFRMPKDRELYARIAEIAREERRSLARVLKLWCEEKVEERDKQEVANGSHSL